MAFQTLWLYLPNGLQKGGQRAPELPLHTAQGKPLSASESILTVKQSLNSRSLVPRMPTQGDRYRRKRMLPESQEITFTSGPRPIQTSNDSPRGWDEDIHPEGQLLYSKFIPSGDRKIRIHTDVALRLKQNQDIITNAKNQLLALLDACSALHTSDLAGSEIEACLMVRAEHPDEVGYYLVNHRDQTVFWLEQVNPETLGLQCLDADIYQLDLTAKYWRHVTDFPHYCSLSQNAWDQLGLLLLLGAVDGQYCQDSTAPHSPEILARFEACWRQAKKARDADCNKATRNWICARLWYDLTSARVQNYWGTNYARLEKTTVIGDDIRPSQALLPWYARLTFWILLWNEPAATMKLLDEAWPGGLIYSKNWTDIMKMFSEEWKYYIFISALASLSSAVFLSSPLFASPGSSSLSPNLLSSFPIFFAITSLALSLCSLVASLSLTRAFRGGISHDVHEAGAYIKSLYSESLGYTRWGILFSLPRVLLRWAFVFFCGGLLTFSIDLHANRFELFLIEISVVAVLFVIMCRSRRWLPTSC